MGGVSTAVDTYAPEHSGDEQFQLDVLNYFQKVGNINEIEHDNTVVTIVDTIVQNAMAFVMQVTTILMGIVFILTLRLQDKRPNKQ